LPNTVDDQFYRRQGPHERAEARAALNIRKDCRLLVQVSQLIPLKGVLELASAFEVVSTGKDASLAIIGSGPLESEMRLRFSNAISARRLLLPGHVDRTEVRRWLMAADGFVLNTLKDNNPLSPIEASFAELPVLLSRKAGNFEEIVRSDDYGFAIDDTSTVQSVIGRFLDFDIDVLRSIGKNCRENADAQFSVKSVVSTFLTKALQLSASKPKIVEVDCHG
jgi:glycosyltransferase involved in cell wall biosynthesis